MTSTEATQVAGSLRDLAKFIETHPELMPSYTFQSFSVFPDEEGFARVLREAGSIDKEPVGDYFSLTKKIGAVKIEWFRRRDEVCKRVKVGEKIVPATEEIRVPERVIPAQPERVEEIYSWECPPSLLKATAPEEQAEEEPHVFQQGLQLADETPAPVG